MLHLVFFCKHTDSSLWEATHPVASTIERLLPDELHKRGFLLCFLLLLRRSVTHVFTRSNPELAVFLLLLYREFALNLLSEDLVVLEEEVHSRGSISEILHRFHGSNELDSISHTPCQPSANQEAFDCPLNADNLWQQRLVFNNSQLLQGIVIQHFQNSVDIREAAVVRVNVNGKPLEVLLVLDMG